uniref:Uncharacterized protein n=1 Tax=Cucumis melo TaxID=3656 RepID=A0A9I9E5H3_CUCME
MEISIMKRMEVKKWQKKRHTDLTAEIIEAILTKSLPYLKEHSSLLCKIWARSLKAHRLHFHHQDLQRHCEPFADQARP